MRSVRLSDSIMMDQTKLFCLDTCISHMHRVDTLS